MADTEMLEEQFHISDDEMGASVEADHTEAAMEADPFGEEAQGEEHLPAAMDNDEDVQNDADAEFLAPESADTGDHEPLNAENVDVTFTSSAPAPATFVDTLDSTEALSGTVSSSQAHLSVPLPATLEGSTAAPSESLFTAAPTDESTTEAVGNQLPQSFSEQPQAQSSVSSAIEPPNESKPSQSSSAEVTQTPVEPTVESVSHEEHEIAATKEQNADYGSDEVVQIAEQDDSVHHDGAPLSPSVDGSHDSSSDEEDGTQPSARVDLLQSVEMPAFLAPYLEPVDEGQLPTEDNNDLDNIRAPPLLLSYAGHTYWVFAELDTNPAAYVSEHHNASEENHEQPQAEPSTSKASAEQDQTTDAHHPTLIFGAQHDLYYAPLARVFDHLHDQFPSFHDDQMEIRLCVQELGIEIPEDNAYANDLTLHDLDRLHIGCDLPGRLHLVLTESPRFIYRFNTLARHVAKFSAAQADVSGDAEEAEDEPLLDDSDLTEAVVTDEQTLTGEAPNPDDEEDLAAELQGDQLLQDIQNDPDAEGEDDVIDPEAEQRFEDVGEEAEADSAHVDIVANEPLGSDPTLTEAAEPEIQFEATQAYNGAEAEPQDALKSAESALTAADEEPSVDPEELEKHSADEPNSNGEEGSRVAKNLETFPEDDIAQPVRGTTRSGTSPKRSREEDGDPDGSVTPTDPHDTKRVKAS